MNAKHGNIAEDLTGQKFGALTVIRRTENRNGRTCWLCKCQCGNTKAVTAHDLKAGKIKSCGCRIHARTNMINLSGQRFGRLTALYATDHRDRKGSVYWHCRCDCGNETDVTESGLVYGNSKSCGCLKVENQKNVYKKLHMIDGTCLEMLELRKRRSDNKSGYRGVYMLKNGRYRVDIGFKGRKYHVGYFESYEEAVKARIDAEEIVHRGFIKAYREWQKKSGEDPNWGKNHPFLYEVDQTEDHKFVIKR